MAKKFKIVIFIICFAAFYSFCIKAALSPSLPNPSSPIILYSNQCRDDLRLVLKQAFLHAKESINVSMYAVTDKLLLGQLQQRANNRIDVNVRFDSRGGTPSLPASLHPQAIKSQGLMHQKIVIIDDHTFFLGSANMTTSSLQLHDNLSVGIYHEGAAQFLKSPSQNRYAFSVGSVDTLLWLLPDRAALKELEEQMEKAKTSIFIAMFTLTQKELINGLIAACQRGVQVTLAIDRYTANGSSKKAVKQLSEAGVEVLLSAGMPLLHHKLAYIDQEQLILGSTNWTESAFQKNKDVLLVLKNLTPSLNKKIRQLTRIIQLESQKYSGSHYTEIN